MTSINRIEARELGKALIHVIGREVIWWDICVNSVLRDSSG
ncbi:hypothetical protein [Photorhabdus temperata]|nr:hypothetical protein [Photorhabdus temperata]